MGEKKPARARVVLTEISSRAWEHPADKGALVAPLSAGCSHARELISVSTTRARAGFLSPMPWRDPDARRRGCQPFDEGCREVSPLPAAAASIFARRSPRTPRRASSWPCSPRLFPPLRRLFAKDVGVAGVPTGLGKQVDQDIEQCHLRVRPPATWPGHRGRGRRSSRRCGPTPSGSGRRRRAGLVLGRPHGGESLGLDVPPGQGLGEGTVEDLAEVPGLPDRQVLDQAQEVGPGDRQRAAGVVLGKPVELGEHASRSCSGHVQVGLRGVVGHGTAPCQPSRVKRVSSSDMGIRTPRSSATSTARS